MAKLTDTLQVSSLIVLCGPFHKHGLNVIHARIINPIYYKVWDDITYPFPNFNSASTAAPSTSWEWINDFISR